MTTCTNRVPCKRCGGSKKLQATVGKLRVAIRCPACADGTQECRTEMGPCDFCGGDGRIPLWDTPEPIAVPDMTCPACHGTGEVCPRCQGARKA